MFGCAFTCDFGRVLVSVLAGVLLLMLASLAAPALVFVLATAFPENPIRPKSWQHPAVGPKAPTPSTSSWSAQRVAHRHLRKLDRKLERKLEHEKLEGKLEREFEQELERGKLERKLERHRKLERKKLER